MIPGSGIKAMTDRSGIRWHMQEKYRQQLDISYSYHLAKRMEKHRTNEELGYRTAGSKAELATGEMLEQEMHTIGFPIIHKDAITVDAWEFERAK